MVKPLEDITGTANTSLKGAVLPLDSGLISGFHRWIRAPTSRLGYEKFFSDHAASFVNPLIYVFTAYSKRTGEETLGLPREMKVRAIFDGTVVNVNDLPNLTRFVKIRHTNELDSFYVHVKPMVNTGQRIETGQIIGSLDNLEYTTYGVYHLQFRLRMPKQRYVDPTLLFPELRGA